MHKEFVTALIECRDRLQENHLQTEETVRGWFEENPDVPPEQSGLSKAIQALTRLETAITLLNDQIFNSWSELTPDERETLKHRVKM